MIRPLAREELGLVERSLPRTAGAHEERLRAQERDEGRYLVAWLEGLPVGHVFVGQAGMRGYPEIRDLGVAERFRRRGLGTSLMAEAERVAAGFGGEQVGLAVGVDNAAARALYAALGYVEVDPEPFSITYEVGPAGSTQLVHEVCTYLRKHVGPAVRELTREELALADEHLPLNRLDTWLAGRSTYLVAWDGARPVGHAHVAWTGTELGVPEVQDVWVAPARRREGVAAALTRAAERLAAARGHGRLSLSVGVGNDAARRLYAKLGYGDAGLPPVHVRGTIMLRGEPFEVDDTLLYLVKQLSVDSVAARSS